MLPTSPRLSPHFNGAHPGAFYKPHTARFAPNTKSFERPPAEKVPLPKFIDEVHRNLRTEFENYGPLRALWGVACLERS